MRTVAVMNGLGTAYRHTVVSLSGNTDAADRVHGDVPFTCHELDAKGGLLRPWRLAGALRAMRPDLVSLYNWGSADVAIGLVVRRFRPWIQVYDGFGPEEAEGQIPRRAMIRRLLYRRACRVVVVSRGLLRMARDEWRIPDERILHQPNGIDTDAFRPGPDETLRERIGIGQNDLLVGTVSHLRLEKNHPLLLRAFLAAAGGNERCHLVFVGTVPEEGNPNRTAYDEMQAVIAREGLGHRVHFAGLIRDVAGAYRALDVFALSSLTEQMPLSVAEAMACGKPVLGTDVGDVKWMVGGENRRFVVPLSDEGAYARAMAGMLEDAGLRTRLGDANRKRAVVEFAQDSMIESYDRLYRESTSRG